LTYPSSIIGYFILGFAGACTFLFLLLMFDKEIAILRNKLVSLPWMIAIYAVLGGVLEGWKITPNDFNLKVKQIQPLGKIEVIPQGTAADEAINALKIASAVYVSERNNPNEIIGVVTAYDVSKAF
jgi:hypothetical protein